MVRLQRRNIKIPHLQDYAVSTIIQNSYPPVVIRRPGLLDITAAGRKLVAIFCIQKLQIIRETYMIDLEMPGDFNKPWADWDDKYQLFTGTTEEEGGDDPYAEYLTSFQARLRSSQSHGR
jgi:hypothetical protein